MLFANSQVMGTFKGFTERGLEFAAEIVAPYDASMLDRPQLGQFVLIELASEEEASLGRITRLVPTGILTSAQGEDYVNTMQRRNQEVPEDLKQQRLKYRVQLKLLGAVRVQNHDIIYVPSQRRLPHLGAKVAYPSDQVLEKICRLSGGQTELGNYVLGEFVYCGAGTPQNDPALCSLDPRLTVTFNIRNLVSRRSVVFARAGYGKSNLIKYLISELYKDNPTTKKGLPVGTLIFDADGEYFWPDVVDHRPGLCDVLHLQDKLMVFTSRQSPNPYYNSWKVGGVKLDIRQLRPRDVVGIAIAPDKQTNQNVIKLKSLSDTHWAQLVDLITIKGLQATDAEVGYLLGYNQNQISSNAAEIGAARSNMFNIVRLLHDPDSTLLNGVRRGLSSGMIVVVDISLLSSAAGEMVAGLLLRHIFSYNQENFTGGNDIIPAIAVIEEAQSVLGRNLEESSPFVEWVKEGRKYDLGAIMITQQPGSLAAELLSQADNWFCFHLLSEGDAGTLGKYNSHYSNDILAHLIAEPIRGNCYMWSAPHQPFVLPVRIRDYEALYRDNVHSDNEPIIVTRANDIMRELNERYRELAEALLVKLKDRRTKYIPLDDQLGVYKGQLFHLIRDIKEPQDVHTENQLMLPLLTYLLGEGKVSHAENNGREYFCASPEAWEAALGFIPASRES